MLMEDDLQDDDSDDEYEEFEVILCETDIKNPNRDSDYDVDYNEMASRFELSEFQAEHLHRVSLKHGDAGMTAKNVAIVWAPNLLGCKSLEVGGVPAYSVPAPAPVLGLSQDLAPGTQQQQLTPVTKCRPKSLAISTPTPTKLLTLEEARSRALTACNNIENQKYIEVGGGPDNLPAKYHTVIELPGKSAHLPTRSTSVLVR